MLTKLRNGRQLVLCAGVAAATAGLTVTLAGTASAVTLDDWTTGHVPTGPNCTVTNLTTSGSDLNVTYTDAQLPTVAGWTLNGSRSAVVLPPGTTTLTFAGRVKQSCGGVYSGLTLYLRYSMLGYGSAYTSVTPTTPTTTNPFDQTFTYSLSANVGYAGWWQAPAAGVVRRFDSVTLNGTDWSYVTSTATAAPLAFVTGPWSTQRVYILLRTTVSTSASKTTVAPGGSVTFRATLKKAGASTYDPAVGSTVLFQTKIGTGSWTTRATKTASSTGTVSYTFTPSKTMSWRWVHIGEKTTKFTAPVTSTVKKITVS